MEFQEIRSNYQDFFNMLPMDWQEIISPLWKFYADTANIYALLDNNMIVAGGIVFKTTPPNRTDFEILIGDRYSSKGYHYIGFLYVDLDRRNEALGSRWLSALKIQFPTQGYWLTIEEEALKHFYIKNGFEVVQQSEDVDSPEWILVYNP
ncbi:MAG: hypothetical protein R3299_14365 [Arenibacter sp.]|nr:hypothetical protein [Arenibacter sp.]